MSDAPIPCLSEVKCASLRDRGYGAGDYPQLSPLPRNSKRRGPIARAPRYAAKLGTLDIQRVLPKTGRGPQLAAADPDERAHGAPAPTAKARVRPRGSRRGSAD